MALRITRKPTDYISDTAYVYDVAKTSKYFDKSVYEGLSNLGDQDAIKQYLYGLAEAKNKTASAFNQYDYSNLESPEDKASYILYKLSDDKNAELDEYFNYKIQEYVDKKTFNSLNAFEKTMSSIGGVVGNALNETLFGTIEGLIDAGAVIVGQKDWAAKDFTGVAENRENIQRFTRAYSYVDKNKFWKISNDVVTGLTQMAPLLIPYVGAYVYFGSMAGNTAADAVRLNPDIDYVSLLSYTGLVTGVEFATEQLSKGLLGGTGNAIDNLILKSSGKGATKLGAKTAGNWLGRVGINFLSEGLEESIAEVADTVLFNALIAQGDEGLRREYSMTDILYAGVIGGLIGGIAEGGRLATTTRYSLTKDGQIIRTKDAKQAGIETAKDFGKLQSAVLSDQLSSAKGLAQTNAITDLIGKYKGKYTAEQLAELHPEEYKKAVEKNKKIQERQTEVILGLNRIFEMAGVEGFNRATDLYNSVFETQQRLLSKYVARATGETVENRAVETEFARKNPGASIKISDSLTAEQTRFKQNFKNKFGINAYFGDLGTENGENRKFGLTLNEDTIILDEKQFGKLSEQAVLDQIVKEELVHALQFTKGIITPKVLFAIHKALRGTEVNVQELDPAYAEDTALTKLTEAQAKAIAQVLIFDDLTVSKMFYSEYSTLNKVYNFFRNIRNKLETSNKDLRTEKGKLKYNTLLKRMKAYRDIAAEKLGTIENVEQFIEEFHLRESEQKQLRNAYLENPNVGPIAGAETIAFSKEKTNALYNFLKKNGINPINYHEKGFSPEFIQLLGDVAPSVTTIKEMLNETTSENETSIGDANATNWIIEFLYKDNKNVKTIEDISDLTSKDKKGYSPLAYSYVYMLKHSPKEGVKISYISEEAAAAAKKAQDPKTPHTKQEVRFDVALKMENGKRVFDKDKLKLKEFELKQAQQTIDDAINQNVLNTILLDADFDYSMYNVKQIFEKAIASTKYSKSQFKEVQFAKASSEEGDELGGEEFVADEASHVENIVLERMGESVDDTPNFISDLPKIIETYKQDFENWLLRSGASEKQGNELDKIKRVVDNIKALEKSEEKIKISAANRDLINQITKPEFLIESVENVVNAENSKTIKKKLENNKNLLVNMYKTDGYNKIHAAANVKHSDAVKATEKASVENVIKEDAEPKKQTDNKASVLKYLNEYFADSKQKLSISFRNGNYHVFSSTSKAETPRDKYTFNNVTDMLTTLQNDGLITENMMTKMSEVLAKGEPDGTFQVETPQGQQLILTGSYERAVPTHLSESSIAYAQTEIFDNIDPNMTEDTRLRTINKAIEQENLALKNRVNITNERMQSKLDELLKLFDNLDVSAFQGKVNDPKVERVSNELFNEHPEAFLDITSTEFVALKDYAVVRIGEGPVYGALTNSLIRYAWLNRFDQFADVQEYVETLYSEWIATGAQAIGLTSSDYETTISHFMKQMALEKGVLEIKLPSDLFLKTIPDFKIADDLATITKQDIDKITEELKTSKNKKSLEAKQKAKKELLAAISSKNNVKIFEASLGVEILDLSDKLKNTKDPLDQRDIREQILNKKIIKAALSADDIGKAIDYQLKAKFEEGVNISQTLQMRNDIYEGIVAHLIKHAEIKGDSVVGVNSKKIPDSKAMEKAKKFFMSVESFRYLMMLSNPATSVKNGAANALMFCQSFVEDGALHLYEKSNWLLPQAAQAKFVGDYDENFKNYVKEMSWDKIKDDCEGDKYTTEEFKKLQRKYAEATDPLKKSKLLTKIQEMERKGLSDTWAVSRRTLLNFTNTLAGSSDLILSYSIDYLKTKYFNRNKLAELQKTKTSVEARQKALVDKIAKTNKPVSDLLSQAIAGDKIAILKIANVANLDIVKPDLKIKNSIYYKSFERANKTFLKTDNYFTELLNKVKKDRPAAGWVINKLIPFARVATNSLLYLVDRSPIGFAKGVHDMFKTRRKWTFEMREAIDGFYMKRYIAEKTSLNKDGIVDMSGYKLWFKTLSDHDGISASKLKQAMNGDDKATREIFEQMVEQGWVFREQIGSNDIFARGDIAEKLAQGSIGTGMMLIGLILGALLDFEYDEDDYLGPVINCKYFKLQLNTLSPISTLITMPAMLFSDVDNKYEKIFEIFADATILSTFDSALSYSDSLWDYIKNQSINIATQYQPAFTKAIAKVFYNKKKDKGSAYWTRLINSMMANSLIFNSLVPNKINPYTGEAEKHYDAGIWEGLLNMVLPVGLRTTSNNAFEREAIRLKAESDGFSGSFTINETDIKLTGKDKQKYASYKAKYISERFDNIYNGREKVTVKDEKTGKFKTVTYDKLTDKEKQKVLKNLYTTGTTVTKIQYWLDKGNSYIVTDRDQYYDYKKLFGNSAKIVYKKSWSTSKFVEG